MIEGLGLLAGTLVMSAWGGTRRKIFSLLGSGALMGIFLVLYGLRASIPLLAVCGFGFMFMVPILNGSSQAIWQAKVAGDVQGRVFSVRRSVVTSFEIIAPLLAAPLADGFFKPGMSAGGVLVVFFGPIFGAGASRGVGLLISILGFLVLVTAIVFVCNPVLRRLEMDLPDHDARAPVAQAKVSPTPE